MNDKVGIEIEQQVARLLTDLTDIQSQLLEVLRGKREAVVSRNEQDYRQLLEQEQQIYQSLERVGLERAQLLQQAHENGIQGETLQEVAEHLPQSSKAGLTQRIGKANEMTQTLRFEQLTNWVVDQQCLLYVSQLLEMIATGGRLRPTYAKSEFGMRGSLLDHEV